MLNFDISLLKEPGAWLLLGLILCGTIQLISSLKLRKVRKALADLVEEIIKEGELTPSDKAWLKAEIDRTDGTHLVVAAPFAPFAILGAIALGFTEAGNKSESSKKTLEKIEIQERKSLVLLTGEDPINGRLWTDPRKEKIEDLAMTIESWNNPVSMLWIYFWLAASLPLLLISYFVAGSLRPFIHNIWQPLRLPISSMLSEITAHRR